MRAHTLVLMLAVCACGTPQPEQHDAGPTDAGPTDAGAKSCIGLNAAACSAAGCVSLSGWRTTGAPSVISGPGEYAGCATPTDLLPGTTLTCALAQADGRCWLFTDTRVPDGWATVSCLQDPSLFCPSTQ
jgi:hypothetical protein